MILKSILSQTEKILTTKLPLASHIVKQNICLVNLPDKATADCTVLIAQGYIHTSVCKLSAMHWATRLICSHH